jgi:hypothetical protein
MGGADMTDLVLVVQELVDRGQQVDKAWDAADLPGGLGLQAG